MKESQLSIEQKKAIQLRLNTLLGTNLVIDGNFGKLTRQAIRKAQNYLKNLNLFQSDVDGKWGDKSEIGLSLLENSKRAYNVNGLHITYYAYDAQSMKNAYDKFLKNGVTRVKVDGKVLKLDSKDGLSKFLNTNLDGVDGVNLKLEIKNNVKRKTSKEENTFDEYIDPRGDIEYDDTHKKHTIRNTSDKVFETILTPFFGSSDESRVKRNDLAQNLTDNLINSFTFPASLALNYAPQAPILAADIIRHGYYLMNPDKVESAKPIVAPRTIYTPQAKDFMRYITMQQLIEDYNGDLDKLKSDLNAGKVITVGVLGRKYVGAYGSKQAGRTFPLPHYVLNMPRRVSTTTGSFLARVSKDGIYFMPDAFDTNYARNETITFNAKNKSGTIRDIHSSRGSHKEDPDNTKIYVNDFSMGFTPSMLDNVDMSLRIFDFLPEENK